MTDIEREATGHVRALTDALKNDYVHSETDCEGCRVAEHAHDAAQAFLSRVEQSAEVVRVPYPGTDGAPTDNPHDMSHMVQISKLIADLQGTLEQFGDTCVYIRRGGLSWGAVALNRRSDDEKFGLFDLQAEYDRNLIQRAEQAQRLVDGRNSERELRWKAEAQVATIERETIERCAEVADAYDDEQDKAVKPRLVARAIRSLAKTQGERT
jgi:hypothetical protein